MSQNQNTVHKEAYLLLFSTFFMFSTIHVMGKVISPYMPTALVVGIRCLITFYGTEVSQIFHIPMSIYTIATQPVTVNAIVVLVLIYLGIVGSGLAQFTWTKSLSLLPAVTCSLFYPLQPVFTTIMGALFLGEHVTVSFLIGLVLISLDIVINIFATSKEK